MFFITILNLYLNSHLLKLSTLLLFIFWSAFAYCEDITLKPPAIQLSNIYHRDININDYLVSEKLDGIRAYWDGKNLISRQGNIFNAPEWFTENFPENPLDGELWIGREQFELVSSIVRSEQAEDSNWKKVHFMIFDMPKHNGVFSERLSTMERLVKKVNSPYLCLIRQYKVDNHQLLMQQLNDVVKNGGEGLILHKENSIYKVARNDDVLKLKKFQDAEAKVIAYVGGKGKYSGMLGSILVETIGSDNKIQFYIGSGFNDWQRKNPPPIGSIITYKYFGKTKNNVPRFASFMRVRYY